MQRKKEWEEKNELVILVLHDWDPVSRKFFHLLAQKIGLIQQIFYPYIKVNFSPMKTKLHY